MEYRHVVPVGNFPEAIKIIRLREKNLHHYIENLVETYRQVFGGDDWKEWKMCSNGHKYSRRESDNIEYCPECGEKLSFYWPSSVVEEKIRNDIALKGSVFVIALFAGKVIGFSWGFTMDKSIAEEHLDNFPSQLSYLAQKNGGYFWYQNELGVLEEFRRRGVAKMLFKERMRISLKETRCENFIIRTYPQAKTFKWYRRIGYKIIHRYERGDLNGEPRYLLWAPKKVVQQYLSE